MEIHEHFFLIAWILSILALACFAIHRKEQPEDSEETLASKVLERR